MNRRNIGVVGNRYGWSYEDVKRELDKLNIKHLDILISGGATGVDSYAQRYAKENGIMFFIAYPNPNRPVPNKYFERNDIIADLSNILVAFQKDKKHSGTQYTINKAKKMKKEVIVISKILEGEG